MEADLSGRVHGLLGMRCGGGWPGPSTHQRRSASHSVPGRGFCGIRCVCQVKVSVVGLTHFRNGE